MTESYQLEDEPDDYPIPDWPNPGDGKPRNELTDPLAWIKEFKLSAADLESISAPRWIYPGLLAESHVVAVVAKPNGGKTTIWFDIAKELAPKYNVVYVNADTGPTEGKAMFLEAERAGLHLLTPDLKVGVSVKDIVQRLVELSLSDADLTGHVWIFDTLKKLCDVISKRSLKDLLQLMRKLSGRGMTCVLLCHTNKYKDDSGAYVYEGTADLESDCDELIYFDPQTNPDGSMTVSSVCNSERGKKRAEIEAMSWDILPNREVIKRAEYVNVAEQTRERILLEQDADVIEVVVALLRIDGAIQSRIIEHCKDKGLHRKTVRAVLDRHAGKFWDVHPQYKDNAKRYTLRLPPEQGINRPTDTTGTTGTTQL